MTDEIVLMTSCQVSLKWNENPNNNQIRTIKNARKHAKGCADLVENHFATVEKRSIFSYHESRPLTEVIERLLC